MSGIIGGSGLRSGIIGHDGTVIVEADFAGLDYTKNHCMIYRIDNIVYYNIVCYCPGTPANNEIVCVFPVGYAPSDYTAYPASSSTGYQVDTIDVVYIIGEDGTGDSSNPRAMKIGSPSNVGASANFHVRVCGQFPVNK